MNPPLSKPLPNSFRSGPDETGHFGIFGGRFVAETLMPLILDLEKAYAAAKADPAFQAEMNGYLTHYVGRPSPLYFAERLTGHLGGAKIYFKREELNHTGSHKVNNVLGQIMVARRMGKKRIIAETGAGQHGVATATLCARFGLECIVYMGAVDVARQAPNVFRMEMLGARVIPVQSGTRTLKDAMNEALRDWVTNVHNTFYCIGTVAGPHPYPMMVRDFQSIIGVETRAQMHEAEGRLPDSLVACIGGGSNAIGLFHPFLDDPGVEIFGVEAAGHGLTQLHAASIAGGRAGVLHGNRTYLLMNDDGQIQDAHSISAGLDYPGIGPEHSWLYETGRVTYLSATDDEALAAFQLLSRQEGIIPALESAHAIAKVIGARAEASERPSDGGQPLRPRRQGHSAGGGDFEGPEEVTTDRRRFLHLSPTGRGRLRSSRVRGLPAQSDRSVLSIISCTPSRLSYTSVLDTRTTRKPQASRTSVRAWSLANSEDSACVTPSTSTISFPSSVTKSTTYRSIECWRRNFHRASRRLRSACQSFASALVCDTRRLRALVLNLSIPLTRLLRSRPLPGGERYNTANAAT